MGGGVCVCLCLCLYAEAVFLEVVKVPEGHTWRDYYEMRLRATGKRRPPCGPEVGVGCERKMMSRFKGKCRVCRGPVYPGDWIYWNHLTGKARHADSGYKKGPF